jgi:ribosomal protein L22
MRAASDRDLVVIEEMLAPPPLEDARSSLEFWQRRHKSLPVYRVSARREAKVMAGRWQERVIDAELVRFERTFFGRLLKRMGVSRIWVQRGSVGRGIVFDVAWALLSRRMQPRGSGRAVAFVAVLAVITALVLVAQS